MLACWLTPLVIAALLQAHAVGLLIETSLHNIARASPICMAGSLQISKNNRMLAKLESRPEQQILTGCVMSRSNLRRMQYSSVQARSQATAVWTCDGTCQKPPPPLRICKCCLTCTQGTKLFHLDHLQLQHLSLICWNSLVA